MPRRSAGYQPSSVPVSHSSSSQPHFGVAAYSAAHRFYARASQEPGKII